MANTTAAPVTEVARPGFKVISYDEGDDSFQVEYQNMPLDYQNGTHDIISAMFLSMSVGESDEPFEFVGQEYFF